MRYRLGLFACLAVMVGCEGQPTPATIEPTSDTQAPDVSPGLKLQHEDYARARRSFKTKLIRRGPAPQAWQPLRTPPGYEEVNYRSGDLTLKAFTTPDLGDGQRHPAVLFLHGGFAFGGEDWAMPLPYRDAGYAVLIPVLRGENGQPGDYTMFFDEVDDVLAAAETLAALTYVDRGRLYIAGHSAGGTLTLLAAMASDRFRAAASFSACVDQVINARWQPALANFEQTDFREFLLRSPVAYATSFQCPVRLYYGSKEDWAPGMTRRTAELAKIKGLDVASVEVSGDHFSSVPEAVRRSLEFFRQH